MVRSPTEADFESYTTDALADYINRAAPVAAKLDDDYADARDAITAEVEAAIAVFRARTGVDRTVATDGGEPDDPSVDDAIDTVTEDDHYLRHVTDETTDFKIRHTRTVRTTVDDGAVVHEVFEDYADDAHRASVSWRRGFKRCPACDADAERDVDGYPDEPDTDVTDATIIETWSCDECAWSVRRASRGAPTHFDGDYLPLWSRTTYPHDFDDDADVDWEAARDRADDYDDVVDTANVIRTIYVSMHADACPSIDDGSYVPAEYDGDFGDDDREKVADAYVDTFECAACGDTVDAAAKTSHAHYGDVCPSCEDVTVWSVDDADLPDDVRDAMDTHKSFSTSRIVDLLRDVIYWGNYVARANDDVDDPSDVPPIKTGKGGKIGTGRGDGRPGTGLRRPKGFAHKFAHFRTVLRDAEDTGLIARVGADDADVDDVNLRWEATDKGRDVFDELARCTTCGARKVPMRAVHVYQAGRRSEKSTRLTLRCPDCDARTESSAAGGMVIASSSGDTSYQTLPGVDYAVDDA